MENKSDKVKFGLVLSPETLEKAGQLYKSDNAKCRSEFIERAIIFYSAYISAESYSDYLPKVVLSTIRGSLDGLESRMASLIFKLAVEVSVLNRVTAATVDISELNLPRIRADCVRDVQRTQGVISLAEAVKDEENK